MTYYLLHILHLTPLLYINSGSPSWRIHRVRHISVRFSYFALSEVGDEFLANASSTYVAVVKSTLLVFLCLQLAANLKHTLITLIRSPAFRVTVRYFLIFDHTQTLTARLDVHKLLLQNTRVWRPERCTDGPVDG